MHGERYNSFGMKESRKTEREEAAGASAEQGTRPFGEQNEDGVDLSLIRENLRLTPTQRLQRHQRALELMKEVRRAGAAAGLHGANK